MTAKRPIKSTGTDPLASFVFEKNGTDWRFVIGRAPVYAIVILCIVAWYGPEMLGLVIPLKLWLVKAS